MNIHQNDEAGETTQLSKSSEQRSAEVVSEPQESSTLTPSISPNTTLTEVQEGEQPQKPIGINNNGRSAPSKGKPAKRTYYNKKKNRNRKSKEENDAAALPRDNHFIPSNARNPTE